jgi:nitrile hydratase subunit beta
VTFTPGQPVRTRLQARPGYLRLPAYARGRTGTVHMQRSDDVYSVRFRAKDLWGDDAGDHDVFLDLLETYLEPA